jgi:hypothetical protein
MTGLCMNCLTYGPVRNVPVGFEKGHQRDPYQEKLPLCLTCETALTNGRFDVLHERYSDERNISREDVSKTKEPRATR